MSSSDDCKHGMNPAWCGDCTGRTGDIRISPDELGPVTAARYDGTCSACGQRYLAGSVIAHSDEACGWISDCCADLTGGAV